MEYRIHPAIGFARLGTSSSVFVGPEVAGSHGRELGPGEGPEVSSFKDSTFRVRKQAARFRIFQHESIADRGRPAVLPADARIVWKVRVANIKDAIVRPAGPPSTIPAGGLRPRRDPLRADRAIDSGIVSIQGVSAPTMALRGTHAGAAVELGELRTDAEGRLLVVGASGLSRASPATSIRSYYTNLNWRDDVCDGPVEAEIVFADGRREPVVGSWVVVGPPDFARATQATVTLYDVIRQMAVDQRLLPGATTTSFTADIYPLLARTRSLRFAHAGATWAAISDDYARLGSGLPADAQLRIDNSQHILQVERAFARYRLTGTQRDHLTRWTGGHFAADWTGLPPIPAAPTAESLTRAALDGTVGAGFQPGIEAGILLTDPSIYRTPFDFRIDPAVLNPGDVTALMAQPWQADFLKCEQVWWPSQRPDIAPQAGGRVKPWARDGQDRPISSSSGHQFFVDHVMKFGMLTPRVGPGGVEVCVEEGRDPAVP